MSEFTIHGTSGRFENSYADLREEIRLMALAEREGAEQEGATPKARQAPEAPRPSLLSRLFTRPATRLAA